MSYSRRAAIVLPIWIFIVVWMSVWWFSSEQINYLPLFIPLSVALVYEFILLPSAYLFFIFRVKYPRKRRVIKGAKVAVISLCVPKKESLYIIEKQLKAMSEINYPHDSWILDEGGSKAVKALAKKYKVKYFSRKGEKKYNQTTAPFKKKTKAGNVNAWLDHVKRRKYEYFVQMDIDHLADPEYLNQTLGYFRNSKVAWVQSPSIYKNRSKWISRGSSEQELVLQGPLQMGFYGHSNTPFIIGSHCTYRTEAIQEIGGFQPTRAEDHLDTVALASKGHQGVFLPKIIAQGDGPETLNTYLAQQFAWAYSMFQVLINYSPKLLRSMPIRKQMQFLFAQTWYPLWSLSYLVMFMVPIISLLANKNVAQVSGLDFLTHFVPLFAGGLMIWWASRPLMQPKNLLLSWRGMLLHVVRWPIVLKAVISALFRVKKSYMITPKGKYASQVLSVRVYSLFLILGFASSLSVIIANWVYGEAASEGQMIFALINSLFMLSVCLVDLNLSTKNIKSKAPKLRQGWLKPVGAVMTLTFITTLAIASSPMITNRVSALFEQKTNSLAVEKIPINQMSTGQLINELSQLDSQEKYPVPPTLGVYNDPAIRSKARIGQPHIDHIFVDWRDTRYLAEKLLISERSNNLTLVTLEPRGNKNGKDLLTKISTGKHDEKLNSIFEILSATDRQIYVRFAHEAELKNLYPWSNQDPELYKKAYRYTINYARSQGASNIQWIWSPAGNVGAEAYYPGNNFVDVIGTTILHDKYWYGNTEPTFHQLALQRMWLFGFNKPVWIVEFGAGNANNKFQTRLVKDALRSYKKLGFSTLVYLNMIDANINGPDYRLADKTVINMQSSAKTVNAKKATSPSKLAEYICSDNNAWNKQSKEALQIGIFYKDLSESDLLCAHSIIK